MKVVGLKSGVESSLKVNPYGGNHITRPPFGPFSQTGRSSYVNPGLSEVLQAKFSIENIYFLTLPSTIFVDPGFLKGAIFKLYVLSKTE